MPKLINRNPWYCRHRASGQAVVTIDNRDIYLGPYGSKASRNEYDRVIAEWVANGRRGRSPRDPNLALFELIAPTTRGPRTATTTANSTA
jgi:hypothetical protein